MNNKLMELELNENELSNMNHLLTTRQFSAEFLAKTIGYYDSWICLKTQKNLSAEFCFKYLFNNDTDSADNWTDLNDIIVYLNQQDKKYSRDEIMELYEKTLKEWQNL
jgi:hypothetical protein